MVIRRPAQTRQRFAVFLAIIFVSLFLLTAFSWERALALTLALLVALVCLSAATGPRFKPFWLHIEPKWLPMLMDHGVISGAEHWATVSDEAEAAPASEHNLLMDALGFTFLSPDLGFDHGTNKFFTSVRYMAPIKEIKQVAHLSECFPKFYVEAGTEGYELGLVTAKSAEAGHDLGDPKSHLKIATLPYNEFCYQWEVSWHSSGFWKAARKRRDDELKIYGWERDPTPNFQGDPHPHPFVSLKHKYFTLYYGDI